jgi:SSS family solute:Na+ symporter
VGLVKGLTPETVGEHVPWFKQPAFVAVLALIVMVLLNVYFW